MAQNVVNSAQITSSMGTAPASLVVTSQQKVLIGGLPAGTISDATTANMATFGMCSSLMNPAVASATAAALGVLTPQPCTPMLTGSWTPNHPKVMIGGKPCLCSDAKTFCAYNPAGCSVVSPGQAKVTAN